MRRPAGSRGLSLAETLAAMFILAVAVLGLYCAQVFSMAAHKKSRSDYRAGAAGSSLLEDLESRHRQSRRDFVTDVTQARAAVPGQPDLEVEVAQEYLSSDQDLKKLTVTVYSRDRDGNWKAHPFWLVVYCLESGR